MELRQLKYFIKAAELLNFSEAAKALCVTQSTLSQQIQQLENELNVKFFERSSHCVRLTDMGAAFLPSALRTIHEANACIDRLHDIQGLNTGSINIGSTYTFCPLLKETVLAFMKIHPGVRVNIFCKSMEELIEMLKKQEIDVVLCYRPTQLYDCIESHIIFDNKLTVVVGNHHPLANRKRLRLSELEPYQLALPSKGMQARHTFDRITDGLDYRLNVRLEINEINVLLDLVQQSQLVTLLSQATVSTHPEVTSIPLDLQKCEMEGAFLLLKDCYLKNVTKAFLKILCENKAFSLAMMSCL